MKRLLSLVIVVLMLCTLGMSVFADSFESPGNPQGITVVVDTPGGDATFEYDEEDGVYKIKADVDEGHQFVKFYIIGEYTIITGSLTEPYIVIKAGKGVEVHAVFDTDSGIHATVEEATKGGTASVYTEADATFRFSAKTNSGYKFVKWTITGEYTIISGSLTSEEVVIKATTDVHGAAYWNGDGKGNQSPQTGYEVAGFVCVALVSLCGAAFAFKKFENE